MITLIFGDNQKDSRLYLSTLTEGKPINVYTEDNMDITLLSQALSGTGLFGDKEIFVLENFLSRGKQSEKKFLIELIKTGEKENEIIFWDNKSLTPSVIKQFPQANVREFRLPQSLFQFLDSIRPGNTRAMVSLHRKSLESAEEELVFFMLVRQLRLLLASLEKSGIEESKRLRPWQKDKLISQAKLIGSERLKELYKDISDLDRRQKVGELPASLPITIDFFLTSI